MSVNQKPAYLYDQGCKEMLLLKDIRGKSDLLYPSLTAKNFRLYFSEKELEMKPCKSLILLVPGARIELAQRLSSEGF